MPGCSRRRAHAAAGRGVTCDALGGPVYDHTGGVPENPLAFLQHRRRRPPPAGETLAQDFVGARLVIPHGNCRDPSQSGRIINEHQPFTVRDDDIMGELILHDDVRND